MRVFTGQQEALNFEQNHETIGFTLPNTSVSTDVMVISTSIDVIIANLYTSLACLIYTVCVYSLITHIYPKQKDKIHTIIQNNKELAAGMSITVLLVYILEMPARLASCITWTVYTGNTKGVLLAVWLPQIYLIIAVILTNIYFHFNYMVQHHKKKDNHTIQSDGACSRCIGWYDGVLRGFSSDVHIVIMFCLIVGGILLSIFPAFIHIFAYPTQVIAVWTLIVAFLFAMTVHFAILIKYYKQVVPKPRRKQRWKTVKFALLRFIPSTVLVLYSHMLVVVVLYSLLIGRGSVITTGPLFVLSVMPSVFISCVTWIAKRMALDGKSKQVVSPLPYMHQIRLKKRSNSRSSKRKTITTV